MSHLDSKQRLLRATSKAALMAVVVFTQACAIWGYDLGAGAVEGLKAPTGMAKAESKITFNVGPVKGISLGSSQAAITNALKKNKAFVDADMREDVPDKGVHVAVYSSYRKPSAASVFWGYINIPTLFILPVYSGQSGFNVVFKVYHDGEKKRSFNYRIDRKTLAWLPLLPFAWANFLTDFETDAFRDVVANFLDDANKSGILSLDSDEV